MRTPSLAVLSSLALLLFPACAVSPAPVAVRRFDPAPMGEMAATRTARAIETTHPAEIEHTWTDAYGRSWRIGFRCRYTTDDQHELLAAACLQAHLAAADEATLAICRTADLDTIAGIVDCEQRLQETLTEVLFPCAAGTLVGTVSGIEWTRWIVQ